MMFRWAYVAVSCLILTISINSSAETSDDKDAVLNWMEEGFRAFQSGELNKSELIFDRILHSIEMVYADSERARKARSLWYSEAEKDFKGEPYERAMAYYYRGLHYLYKAEYDNARASFLGGLLQDAFAEEDQHRSDFAALMYLSAWAASLMGSEYLKNEAIDELVKIRPDAPVPQSDHNTLVIVETGDAPRKLADGIGHYELVYRPGKNVVDYIPYVLRLKKELSLYPIEDLYYQASTRGGRQVDRIVKGKATFKSNQAVVGQGLSQMSSTAAAFSKMVDDSMEVREVSRLVSLIGVANMVMATRVDAKADTRYWKSLPGKISVMTLNLNPTVDQLDISFKDEFDDLIPELNSSAKVIRDKNGYALVWIRV